MQGKRGVLGDETSTCHESFSSGWDGLLDYPHYTRPRVWQGLEVPEVLLSGDHGKIRKWRAREALFRTLDRRPDLICEDGMDEEKRKWIAEWRTGRTEKQPGGVSSDERLTRHERD